MNANRRWMKSSLQTAATSDVKMPWARGQRRTAFIASRKDLTHSKRVASA